MAETYLAQAIRATDKRAAYDENARTLLADRQILAWILKYSVKEFRDMEIGDVISCITDDIEVGDRPVAPGLTNLGRIHGTGTVDSVPGEGTIIYDIRFTAFHKGIKMKFLMNVELQRSSDSTKLGYHLDYRIVFYLSRMISAQKQTEFFHSDFDHLKHVRSIWLCMDREKDGDSIEEISLVRRTVFGGAENPCEMELMKGIIIHLRKGENLKESQNPLIAMLEKLFSQKSPEEKKQFLEEECGMVMTVDLERRMRLMCNWSENLIEDGWERGREEGIEMFILDNLEENVPPLRILDKLQRRFQLDSEKARLYFEKYAYVES